MHKAAEAMNQGTSQFLEVGSKSTLLLTHCYFISADGNLLRFQLSPANFSCGTRQGELYHQASVITN